MNAAVLFLLCTIVLTNADLEGNFDNGCPKDTSIEKLLPHKHCDQYYQCRHGTLIARFCPSGLHFNADLGICDWSGEANCYTLQKKREVPTKSKKGKNKKKHHKYEEHSDELDNSEPSHVYAICSASDSNGNLVAHENCHEFYKCSYGKPVPLKCAEGLLYNAENEKCDWPQNVDCGERFIFGGIEQNTTNFKRENNDIGIAEDNDIGNVDPNQATTICAVEGSDGVLVAHEVCNRFFKCFNGVPVPMKCPNQLVYNPSKEYCDWPRNVDCDGRLTPDSDEVNLNDGGSGAGRDMRSNENEENEFGSGEDNSDVIPVQKLDNENPDLAPLICSAQNSAGMIVAHENCNQFYKCSRGRPIALKCPTNLLYDPYRYICDYPHNVDCGDRTLIDDDDRSDNDNESTTAEEETTMASFNDPRQASEVCNSEDSDGVMIPHENCNEFYKCYQKRAIALRCQGNLLYSIIKEHCDWPSHVNCGNRNVPDRKTDETNSEMVKRESSNGNGNTNVDPSKAVEICELENSNGVLIAHENCNQFYKCFDSKPVALFCQLNLLYNPTKEYCDWPQNVDCGDRVVPAGNNHNRSDDAHKIIVTRCTGQPDGFIVPHENCNQFYKCLSGQTFPMDCPPGLLFNAHLKVCDWPMNVECGDRLTDVQSPKHGVVRRGLRIVVPIPAIL